MFACRLILSIALLLGFFQSAGATPACENVDDVLETVSLLRSAKFLDNETLYDDTIYGLETTLSRISLPSLQPEPFREAFPDESRALFIYISNLRQAVAHAGAGYDDEALGILKDSSPAIISQSLLTLNGYWNCTNSEIANEIEGPLNNDNTVRKGKALSASETEKGLSTSLTSGDIPSAEKASPRTLPKSISNGPSLDIKGRPLLFFSMVLLVIALIYAGRRYSRRSRLRDHRHLIHRDAAFKIGKKHYQMTIIDITQKGLKFKHDGLIKRQRKIRIDLNGDWFTCRLVWKNDNFAGAQFKNTLSDATFEAILKGS